MSEVLASKVRVHDEVTDTIDPSMPFPLSLQRDRKIIRLELSQIWNETDEKNSPEIKKTFNPIRYLLPLVAVAVLLAIIASFPDLLAASNLKLGFANLVSSSGTMVLDVIVYAKTWGWVFGIGLLLSIFIHDLGHLYMAWKIGVPISASFFVPCFGALIIQRKFVKSAWDEALIGIGGPIAGTATGTTLLLVGMVTDTPLFVALAFSTFLINLFNLMPILPLDGGWISGAISSRFWLLGILGLTTLFFSGAINNPFLVFVAILSLPRIFRGIFKRNTTEIEVSPVSSKQRLAMGLGYLSLVSILASLMIVAKVV